MENKINEIWKRYMDMITAVEEGCTSFEQYEKASKFPKDYFSEKLRNLMSDCETQEQVSMITNRLAVMGR